MVQIVWEKVKAGLGASNLTYWKGLGARKAVVWVLNLMDQNSCNCVNISLKLREYKFEMIFGHPA